MAGKFEVYQDKASEYRFRLKAGNGETILTSEGYAGKSAAMNGISSVQKNCGDTSLFESKETKGGSFRFDMKAKNHQVIGTSQNYKTRSGRDNGIGAVARAAEGAKIVDLSAKA
jgi:uncharacterized protein YegP (UPF0339 family)